MNIAAIRETISNNRFIPVPAEEQNFVGDGHFLDIGCEFLEHFVTLGGLRPSSRVLDIGCGIGRMALPMTQYLDNQQGGRYDGFDIVSNGIAWCEENITSRYPWFRFRHFPFHNSLYNAESDQRLGEEPLPYDTDGFDFIFLTSVFTHLKLEEMGFYLHEIRRLLAAGGRAFLTAFLVRKEDIGVLTAGKTRPSFAAPHQWPFYVADPEHPMAAVAVADDYFRHMLTFFGLRLVQEPVYGNWAHREARNFQDMCVIEALPA